MIRDEAIAKDVLKRKTIKLDKEFAGFKGKFSDAEDIMNVVLCDATFHLNEDSIDYRKNAHDVGINGKCE